MDRTIEKIIELLTASVKTQRGIKEIYNGDPYLIPKANMPSIIVARGAEGPSSADTQKDEDVYNLAINLISDARDKMNPSTISPDAEAFISKTMGEKNADFTYKSDTILGVVRQQLYCLDGYNLKTQNESVEYGLTAGGFLTKDRTFPTMEAALTFQVVSIPYNRTP